MGLQLITKILIVRITTGKPYQQARFETKKINKLILFFIKMDLEAINLWIPQYMAINYGRAQVNIISQRLLKYGKNNEESC